MKLPRWYHTVKRITPLHDLLQSLGAVQPMEFEVLFVEPGNDARQEIVEYNSGPLLPGR